MRGWLPSIRIFNYVVSLSRAQEDWTGHRGYVQDRVREIVGKRTDMQAYICGLNDMVSATRDLLQNEDRLGPQTDFLRAVRLRKTVSRFHVSRFAL